MRITYEVITPESAEHADVAERGFIEPSYNIAVPVEESLNKEDWPAESLVWTLRDAELFLGRASMEDCGDWFQQIDGSTDYQSGTITRYALHPSNGISPASYDRLKRIFCMR